MPLTKAATGACSKRDCGGEYSLFASLLLFPSSFSVVVSPPAKYVVQRCVLKDFSNASEAATNASSNIRKACFSNTSLSKGLVSTPTRAKEFPQYSQCSKTDANAPPSSTLCNDSSKAFLYDSALCEDHAESKIADSSAVTSLLLLLVVVVAADDAPSVALLLSPSLKMARYCVTTSNTCTLCTSVNFFARSYGANHLLTSSHAFLTNTSLLAKNALLSAVSLSKYLDLRTCPTILKHSGN
mmetsp:Transcript_4622/g.14986  ORF Transcript_4622/g.14986 Transcript_4622/m.14986 type:complete len:241 (-) Transcript_4622:557-1279(-)